VEGAVKVNLDNLPVDIEPIIEGIDKPSRDRMLVLSGQVCDHDPTYYMRKFGYLFELKIGKGRLLVCTFNFTNTAIEGRYLLSCLMGYLSSEKAVPCSSIDSAKLREYLTASPSGGRIPETPMNEYWERDSEPVETKLFWEEVGVDLSML
jgi:hypothetical protein